MDLSTQGYNLGNRARDFSTSPCPISKPRHLGPSVPSLKLIMGTMAKLHPPELVLGHHTPIYAHTPHGLCPHRPPETCKQNLPTQELRLVSSGCSILA